jgi:hypothetical protein
MRPALVVEESSSRASRLIAEALVQRYGPRRIVASANRLGLPPQLTRAVVVACSATALDAASGARAVAAGS